MLDRVIDINYYPIAQAASSNAQWRPIGLGLMGLQDVFFQLHLPFDSDEARNLSTRIQEEIYYHALNSSASCENLQRRTGTACDVLPDTRLAEGQFQFESLECNPKQRTCSLELTA